MPPSPWESLPCTADAYICIRGCGSASCFVSALIPQSCFRATLSPPAFWEAEAQNPMAEANFGPAGRDEARKNGGLHQDLTSSSFWRQKWKRTRLAEHTNLSILPCTQLAQEPQRAGGLREVVLSHTVCFSQHTPDPISQTALWSEWGHVRARQTPLWMAGTDATPPSLALTPLPSPHPPLKSSLTKESQIQQKSLRSGGWMSCG